MQPFLCQSTVQLCMAARVTEERGCQHTQPAVDDANGLVDQQPQPPPLGVLRTATLEMRRPIPQYCRATGCIASVFTYFELLLLHVGLQVQRGHLPACGSAGGLGRLACLHLCRSCLGGCLWQSGSILIVRKHCLEHWHSTSHVQEVTQCGVFSSQPDNSSQQVSSGATRNAHWFCLLMKAPSQEQQFVRRSQEVPMTHKSHIIQLKVVTQQKGDPTGSFCSFCRPELTRSMIAPMKQSQSDGSVKHEKIVHRLLTSDHS